MKSETPHVYEVTERAGKHVAGHRVKAGDTLTLTPRQADYEVRVGNLRRVGASRVAEAKKKG